MGTATLGYPGGPAFPFRIDPDLIDWVWQIQTNVVDTIGGRVVQVLGARLSDLTVTGSFGEDHTQAPGGQSWELAEQALDAIAGIMEAQSADATVNAQMHPPAVFTYPPYNWRFSVYVKAITDPDGESSVMMRPGKFSHRYTITMFIVQDGSASLVQAGTTNGVLSQKAYDAVSAYMARISDGIGWRFSQFNGPVSGTLNNPH